MNGENEDINEVVGGQVDDRKPVDERTGDEVPPKAGDVVVDRVPAKQRKNRSSSRIVAVLRSELDKIVIKSGATPKAVREALAKGEEPGNWVILCISDEFTLAAQTKMVLARAKK